MRKSAMNSAKNDIQEHLNPDIPLHFQIYSQLKAEIAEGLWVGSKEFYSEDDISRKFGVSVITVRKALARLSGEGLIYRSRGRRTEVLYDPAKSTSKASSRIFNPAGMSRPFKYKVLSIKEEVATAEACQAFDVPTGSRMWQCHRLRFLDGRRHSVHVSVLPTIELARDISHKDLEKLPMWQVLAMSGHKRTGVTRKIEARFPPAFIARELRITTHEPVLVYTYVSFGKNNESTDWTQIHVSPNEPSLVETIEYKTGKVTME
jgi:DNA-binding GntR family transcriptional regulator